MQQPEGKIILKQKLKWTISQNITQFKKSSITSDYLIYSWYPKTFKHYYYTVTVIWTEEKKRKKTCSDWFSLPSSCNAAVVSSSFRRRSVCFSRNVSTSFSLVTHLRFIVWKLSIQLIISTQLSLILIWL